MSEQDYMYTILISINCRHKKESRFQQGNSKLHLCGIKG